jgi:hypothetical protein
LPVPLTILVKFPLRKLLSAATFALVAPVRGLRAEVSVFTDEKELGVRDETSLISKLIVYFFVLKPAFDIK